MPKRNLFFRKNRKFFEKTVYLKNIPHLFPLGNFEVVPEKAKNLPAESGEQGI